MNPILIVDDEAAIAMLVRRILTGWLPLSGRDRQPRGGKSAGKEPL